MERNNALPATTTDWGWTQQVYGWFWEGPASNGKAYCRGADPIACCLGCGRIIGRYIGAFRVPHGPGCPHAGRLPL